MYSITFRTCLVPHFRNCLNKYKVNTKPVIVSNQYLTTDSQAHSVNVQTKDIKWQNVYKGTLGPRIRNLKIVSFMTSGVGLCVQPMLLQKASEIGTSLAATIGVCVITGVFTFITPVLIHLVTRKYVTSVEYNKENDEYMASVLSFFLKPIKVQFKPHHVRLPMSQKLTVTFYAKEYPFFVDPQSFVDVMHYQRILGYDKPYEFNEGPANVCKKPVVKPISKS
ncbi:TMEM70 family [Cinara cedri]|uniref:TMEM70 family n=1 Tax=Cinara cedri TaxID=506608 RepID=A0A5E4NDN8_9HEMI|nr:TMEM70 family [Cinara cedri]